MPVPRPADHSPEPRRLLRDVVYDQLFVAILDGTLELGERLNDEELVRWLGVSRTPVREAISKLAEQGLIDIEANRYTRVVAPTYPEFLDVVQTGYEVWSLFVRRGVPNLSDDDQAFVLEILGRRATALKAKKRENLPDLAAMNDRILAAAGSSMLTRLWASTGPLTVLLFQRAAARDIFPWEPGISFTTALEAAVKKRDGEAASELVRNQPSKFADYFEAVRGSKIYPEGR